MRFRACAHPGERLDHLDVTVTHCTARYVCTKCRKPRRVESWNLTLLPSEKALATIARYRRELEEDA